MSADVLPDSRLSSGRGRVVADWVVGRKVVMRGGRPVSVPARTIRLELEPIHCFNCGRGAGHVPVGIMTYASWLCEPCSVTWGAAASLHTAPDQQFWDAVSHEILKRFGRPLSKDELDALADQGKLGTSLEILNRESPYKMFKSKP